MKCGATVVLAMLVGGCSVRGELRASIHKYEAGNYNAVAQLCWEMSDREDDMNEKAHVRYLVYCGLTQYRLGNRGEARQMLTRGSSEYSRGRSGWLKPGVVDEMLKALDDLEGRPARTGEPSSVLSDAVAEPGAAAAADRL